YAQIRKAALISVFGSRNLSDNPLDTKMYMALMKDSSFNLTPIVNKFDALIREKFLPEFPFPFISKDEVVKANGYPDLKKLTKWANDNVFTTPADGYVPIAAYGIVNDDEAIKKSFELLPADVDVVMIAFIDFNLYDDLGFGGLTRKKVNAYVNLKIFDRKGERIFKLKERASSDKGMAAYGGFVLETEKVLPLIENAADKLFGDMKETLPKSLKKMARKLEKSK
ncbi:MAG: hypothetical protein NTU44_09840, partial [Bacteroidetes bacterium]|nr:hypothetical protein [Bacteroidota bacterium]